MAAQDSLGAWFHPGDIVLASVTNQYATYQQQFRLVLVDHIYLDDSKGKAYTTSTYDHVAKKWGSTPSFRVTGIEIKRDGNEQLASRMTYYQTQLVVMPGMTQASLREAEDARLAAPPALPVK